MEEKLKSIEQELQQITEAIKPVLFDIRAFIMEAKNPLRPYDRPGEGAQDIEKGAKDNGSRAKS